MDVTPAFLRRLLPSNSPACGVARLAGAGASGPANHERDGDSRYRAVDVCVQPLDRFSFILRSGTARSILCILFAVALDSSEVLASASNCFWPLGLCCLLITSIPSKNRAHSL